MRAQSILAAAVSGLEFTINVAKRIAIDMVKTNECDLGCLGRVSQEMNIGGNKKCN